MMKTISRTRLKVYDLAVQGYYAVKIASMLGITKQAVAKHLRGLVKENHLKPLNKSEFVKGENYKVLDEVCQIETRQPQDNLLTDGYSQRPTVELPIHANLHRLEVRAYVKVISIDMGTLHLRKPDGSTQKIPFLTRHSTLRSGVKQWFTEKPVEINGKHYNFKYQEYPNGEKWLTTWIEGRVTLEELKRHGEKETYDLVAYDQALPVFNWLQKWGGWRTTLPERVGEPHKVIEGGIIEAVRDAIGTEGKALESQFITIDRTPPRPDGKMQLEPKVDVIEFEKALAQLPDMLKAVSMLTVIVQALQTDNVQMKADFEEIKKVLLSKSEPGDMFG